MGLTGYLVPIINHKSDWMLEPVSLSGVYSLSGNSPRASAPIKIGMETMRHFPQCSLHLAFRDPQFTVLRLRIEPQPQFPNPHDPDH